MSHNLKLPLVLYRFPKFVTFTSSFLFQFQWSFYEMLYFYFYLFGFYFVLFCLQYVLINWPAMILHLTSLYCLRHPLFINHLEIYNNWFATVCVCVYDCSVVRLHLKLIFCCNNACDIGLVQKENSIGIFDFRPIFDSNFRKNAFDIKISMHLNAVIFFKKQSRSF